MSTDNKQLIQVKGLKKYYGITAGLIPRVVGEVKAVDGVSFDIKEGQIMGLVGESGCGKSTLGKTILRLEEPTGGDVFFKGASVRQLNKAGLRQLRGKIQIVFQDPDSSLDPRMSVGDSIEEALIVQSYGNSAQRVIRVGELLEKVGLRSNVADRYPHEFSGGQKQRIGIARALAMSPDLIIADEPVSALDVSIQAQILNLLMDIKEKDEMAFLFISHDLAVVRHMSDHVAVMYLGKIVEHGATGEFYNNALHPYTEALFSAVAQLRSPGREKILLKGDVPSPLNPPSGCHFHPRCHRVLPICSQEEPELKEVSPGYYLACHLYR